MAGTGPNNKDLCYRLSEDEPHEWGSVIGCDCVEYDMVDSLAQITLDKSAKRGTAGVNVNKDLDEVAAQQLRDAFESTIVLNKDDPFESVLVDIIRMNRRKRADYAADADIFSNFRDTASMLGLSGFGEQESALFNILQKIARLKSLRANGRMDNPNNESAVDTVLDLAVYSVIYLALMREANVD